MRAGKLLLRVEMEVMSPREVAMLQQGTNCCSRVGCLGWLRVKEVENISLPKEPYPLWKLE